MALKSSQPRRRASLKSDKLSFRMIAVLGSPNACRSCFATFSKYWVAMDASPSRAERWKPRALSPRASAPSCLEIAAAPSAANQVQGEEALPDDTCRDRFCKTSAKEVHGHSRLGELCV